MYFRVNLKMKESRFCCCFRWIVFIEINFTVAFQLIMKTWDNRFVGKIGWWGILRNGVGGGVDTPLRTMSKNQDLESEFLFFNCMYLSKSSTKKMIIFIIFKNYKINLVFLPNKWHSSLQLWDNSLIFHNAHEGITLLFPFPNF